MDRPRRRSGVLSGGVGIAAIEGGAKARRIAVRIRITIRRRVSGGWIAASALLLAAAGPAAPPLRAMRWLAPRADAARILSHQPPECFKPPAAPEAAYSAELGRAAFRSPLLLGGQAARAGVACETCHRNGRTNPDFDFPGLSGAPGTADVTSSLFSSHRGDGIDNPKPIPDLGGTKAALKVRQNAPGELETFIHGLVTEEFDGAEPSPAVLKGLADYVRAMDPAVCLGRGPERLTAALELGEARRAVRAAQAAVARHDVGAGAAMLLAARASLGRLSERYDGPGLQADRQALAAASEALAASGAQVRGAAWEKAMQGLVAWTVDSVALERRLTADEPRSLYNPARLARVARRRG